MAVRVTLEDLQLRLGHSFTDESLLETALTHRSWANEQGLSSHYERTEFLGDAVLDLVVAHWLYEHLPDLSEGELSKLKSVLVSEPVLARWARQLSLGHAMRLGIGEARSGGRDKRSLLADAIEAVLGAVYLDGGLQAARRVTLAWLADAVDELETTEALDPKTALQERAQGRGLDLPTYELVREEGPDHEKRFSVECWIGSHRVGSGSGASKKQAEQMAARAALSSFDVQALEADDGDQRHG